MPNADNLEVAVELWKRGSVETDAWSRATLRNLLDGTSTPESVAMLVYAAIKPRTARRTLASPKVKNGKLSVRNLENAIDPVRGGGSARKNLEAVLKLYYHRNVIATELEAFAHGDKSWKLYGLIAILKSRLF